MVAVLSNGTRLLAGYIPSNVLSYIGVIIYGALTVIGFIHLCRMGRKFMITLLVGLMAMTAGFVLRIILHNSPSSLGIYIFTTLLLLLSPCAFLAVDYVILSRLSRHLGEDTVSKDCLIIRPSLLIKLFCWIDGLTFFLQISGGGMAASNTSAELGRIFTLVGLGIQLFSFSFFIITLIIFGCRVKSRFPDIWADSALSRNGSLFAFWISGDRSDWTTLYLTLLVTTIGIMIRCVFRFCEYTQSYDGNLASHEAFFYLLDALPLAIAMSLFMVVWPPRFLPLNSYSDLASVSSSKEEHLLSSRGSTGSSFKGSFKV